MSSEGGSMDHHDIYCWCCHNAKTTQFCSTCVRSYHLICVGRNTVGENWKCNTCNQLKLAESNWEQWKFDETLLEIVIERLITYEEFKCFRNTFCGLLEALTSHQIRNIIDLDGIEKKVKENLYKTPEELLIDIKWIKHNCAIAFSGDADYKRLSNDLVSSCELELSSFVFCSECYQNWGKYPKTWFGRVCEKPHLIVWAKAHTYPYWPAKLMSAQENEADVQFFGDHSHMTIPIEKCFIFSKKHPSNKPIKSELFDIAMLEVDTYITNIENKFGEFVYGIGVRESIKYESINNYRHHMIPALANDEIVFKRLTLTYDDATTVLNDSFEEYEETLEAIEDELSTGMPLAENVENEKTPTEIQREDLINILEGNEQQTDDPAQQTNDATAQPPIKIESMDSELFETETVICGADLAQDDIDMAVLEQPDNMDNIPKDCQVNEVDVTRDGVDMAALEQPANEGNTSKRLKRPIGSPIDAIRTYIDALERKVAALNDELVLVHQKNRKYKKNLKRLMKKK